MSCTIAGLSCVCLNVSRVSNVQKGMPRSCASAFRDINSAAGSHKEIVYSQGRLEGQCRRCIVMFTRVVSVILIERSLRALRYTCISYLLLANVVHVTV